MSKFTLNQLDGVKPYLPASQEIWSLAADTTSLKLDWNESSREPSPLVRQALVELVQSDRLRYYPNVRNEALLEELACYTKCSPKTLNYFSGSDALHECIIRAFVEKGDTVCIFGPTYDNFRLISEVSGAQIRRLDFKTMFEYGASRLFLSGAKLAYICNPNNPTGEFVPPQDLLKLFDYNPETLFVVDEAYVEFCPELSVAGCVAQHDNVIICRTLSKAFGLASIRFGYSICHPSLNDVLALVRNTKSVSMFAQVSAIAALRDEQYMMEYVREVEVVRKKTIELLTSTMGSHLKIFDGKGNFLLIEFADIEVKNKLVMVLNRNKVYVRSFDQSSPFHHCIRLSLMSLESFKHFQAILEEELALVK